MSKKNVDLVKALLPQPDTDISSLFRDEEASARMRDALSPLLTDDFESATVLAGETRTYAGPEGFRELWLDWLEPWATYRSITDEVIDVGERVVVLFRDYGRRQDMEAEIELIGAAIWTIRGGKVARIEHHSDRAQALEAAGLQD
jgi:SnoaL-like domain